MYQVVGCKKFKTIEKEMIVVTYEILLFYGGHTYTFRFDYITFNWVTLWYWSRHLLRPIFRTEAKAKRECLETKRRFARFLLPLRANFNRERDS